MTQRGVKILPGISGGSTPTLKKAVKLKELFQEATSFCSKSKSALITEPSGNNDGHDLHDTVNWIKPHMAQVNYTYSIVNKETGKQDNSVAARITSVISHGQCLLEYFLEEEETTDRRYVFSTSRRSLDFGVDPLSIRVKLYSRER